MCIRDSNSANTASDDPGGSFYEDTNIPLGTFEGVYSLPTDFRTYELGFRRNGAPQIAERRILWNDEFFMEPIETGHETDPDTGTRTPTDGHNLGFKFEESLGETNDWYTGNQYGTNPFDDSTNPIAYPWLQINNRPYVSHLELVNVPIVGLEDLGRTFTIEDLSLIHI